MQKKNVIQIGILAVFILVIGLIFWQWAGPSTSANPLSEEDAKRLAMERYGGNIVDISLINGIYLVSIQLETGIYDIQIDRSSGDVKEIIRKTKEEVRNELTEEEIGEIVTSEQAGEIKKIIKITEGTDIVYDVLVENDEANVTLTIDAKTGELINKVMEEKNHSIEIPTILTEAEAVSIALNTVSGVVDDVDLESSNGLTYYLVEIERDDDQEATVQINAITGEVMSITWDD